MGVLNKKVIFSILAVYGFLQMIFLLAISADFLLADMSSVEITVRTEDNQTVLQGERHFYADISTGHSLHNLIFYFNDLTTTTNSYSFYGGVSPDLRSWSAVINTTEIPDGEYSFYAKGIYESIFYDSQNYISVTINNSAPTNELQINFDSATPTFLSGENIISATTNIEPDSVEFRITSPQNLFFTTIKNSPTNYQFIWDTVNFPDGYYNIEAIAIKGTFEVYASFGVNVKNDSDDDDTATTSDTTTDNTGGSSSSSTDPNIEITVSESGNRKDFQAASNMPLENVVFYFDNLNSNLDSSSSSLQFPGTSVDTTDSTNWSLNLADGYLMADVNYNFYVIGSFAGIPYSSINDIFIPATSNEETTTPDTPDDNIDDTTNTTTEPLILTFLEHFDSHLFGDQQISISANQEIHNCIFKIYGSRYEEFIAIKDNLTKCHIILHTKDFSNGDYTIKAVAKNDFEMVDIRLDIKIENLIAIAPEPDQPPATELVLDEPSTIETQPKTETYPSTETQPADEIYPVKETAPITYDDSTYPKVFVFELPAECQEKNLLTSEECQKYMSIPFECREKNILNLEECKKFMMENFMPFECKEAGITTKEECDYLLRNTYTSFESFSTAEIMPSYTTQAEERISEECRKQGITSFEECKKQMMLINMPEECQEAGETNPDECKKIMFKEYGPQECIQAQIFNEEECEKFMFKEYAPEDCQEAGILNPEACKKFMFEKYSGGENIPAEKFPIECQKANAKTIEECERIMQKTYLPKECANEGLENEQECETYLQQKHMPEECLEAGAKNRQECDKIMFKKFGPPECKIAGIEDEKECEEFMFNKYAPKVKCDNIEDWQCKASIKERHLGNIVAKQTVFNKINEKKNEIIGRSMQAEDLEIEIAQEQKVVPIVEKDLGIKIIATSESIVLNEEDYLIQTAPIAFMIDSDKDGLPDDIEKRLGTNPFKADTDEDGHNDGEEIKNGYNPLGEGKFEKKIAPVEKAIMEDKLLGHPKTEGEEKENFFVEDISNMEDTQGNSVKGYILSGMAKPNSVATLYIYSDLPVVVTVDADQYGNWRYQFDQSLIEGEHEVYVAINDDTGKVIEKSKPLNFFIKEASAVSVKDFVSVAKASSEESKESEVSIFNYLLVTLFMAIVGIFLFLSVIISRKKNQSLQ